MDAITDPTAPANLDTIQTREELGAALTALRAHAGLTVRELASRVGLPSATVGGYVTARHLPSPTQIGVFRTIIAACGVTAPDTQQRWINTLLRVRRASDGRAARQAARGAGPYRGLLPFEAQDAALFFGREAFVSQILAKLHDLKHRARAAQPGFVSRLVFLVGASGSGKSSVLRAGVYSAAIARTPGDAEQWHATVITPGRDPMSSLDTALRDTPEPRVVIIDQFEELYTLASDDVRDRFLSRLAGVGDQTVLVAGLRADFFTQAARDPRLVPALQDWQLVVPPMSREELQEVIVAPARARGVMVEQGLVDAVLSEVFPRPVTPGAPPRQHALPLLSHALASTWEHRARGPLTLDDYLGAGGLAGAVQQSAEAAFAELPAGQGDLCRRLFLRLITVDEDLTVTRRKVDRDELDDLATNDGELVRPHDESPVSNVIERFVSRRLITVDDSSVEISHEALLVAWSRLAGWVASDHEGLRLHRRLTSAAYAWQEADFDDQLLLRGTQLTATEEWVADPDHRADLNRLERDFVQSSVAGRTLALRTERRRAVTLRMIVAALAVLLLVAVGTTVYALHATSVADRQRHAANIERDEALSREIAIESQRASTTDLALAGQLGLAALRTSPTADARSALLDALSDGVVSRLLGPSGPTAIARNPAGTIEAISNAATGTVALHKIVDGRPRQTLSVIPAATNSSQVFAIAFDHDGDEIALGGLGGAVRLVDVADVAKPTLQATAPGRLGPGVQALAFARSDAQLYAAGGAPGIRAWTIRNPDDPTPLPEPAGLPATATVQSLAIGPQGMNLIAGTADGHVLVWPLRALATKPASVTLGQSAIDFVAVPPAGSDVLVGAKDASVTALDLAAPGRPRVLSKVSTDFTSWANVAVFSPDGSEVAVGSADGKIDILRSKVWSRMRSITDAGQVTALDYDATGEVLTAASADGIVRSIPVDGDSTPDLGGPSFSVDFSTSGHTMLTATTGVNGAVATWTRTASGIGQARYLPLPSAFGHPDGIGAIAPDGRFVATGNAGGKVVTDTLDSSGAFGGQPQVLSAGDKTLESVVISPDSRLLAASSDDGHVYLWDVSDPGHPRALPPPATGSEVVSVAFGAGSKYLAAATVDHKVHLWDLSTPDHARPLGSLGGFTNYAWSVAFSPNSKLLAAGGADNTIRLWDFSNPAHPRELGTSFVGPTHYVFSLAFSPDNKTLAASGGDGSVWTWSLADPSHPAVVSTLHAADPDGGTYAVAFTPDGKQLAAVGTAGRVTMWDTDVDAATEVECRLRGTPLTRTEWHTYVPGAPYRNLCP